MDRNVTCAQVTIYGTDQYTCLFPAHAGEKEHLATCSSGTKSARKIVVCLLVCFFSFSIIKNAFHKKKSWTELLKTRKSIITFTCRFITLSCSFFFIQTPSTDGCLQCWTFHQPWPVLLLCSAVWHDPQLFWESIVTSVRWKYVRCLVQHWTHSCGKTPKFFYFKI